MQAYYADALPVDLLKEEQGRIAVARGVFSPSLLRPRWTTNDGLILINEGLAAAWWPRSAPTPARGPAYQEAQYAAEDAGIGSGEHCDQVGRRRSD